MDFEVKIIDNNLTIYCSNGLKDFANNFVRYYNENINYIKRIFNIKDNLNITITLFDDPGMIKFPYGISDFSGFFNDTGARAYINLNGKRSIDAMYKGIMHEVIHHIYKYYFYGKDKKRITWVDEGLAQYFSKQKEMLDNPDLFNKFINDNLQSIDSINLNELNHGDRSFGNNNGYNLSYLAIRYLYENNSYSEFIQIIKNEDVLNEIGETIMSDMYKYYMNNKMSLK